MAFYDLEATAEIPTFGVQGRAEIELGEIVPVGETKGTDQNVYN